MAQLETEKKATQKTPGWIRVGTPGELTAKGVMVVQGADRPVSVWAQNEAFLAVDNRCPHMGFPLHKGTLKDGILTCHWHHARFDVCSGCTFDQWADDVASYDTKVSDGVVLVAAMPRQRADRAYYLRRLRKGLRQNVALLQAKALAGLQKAGVAPREILREIVKFAGEQSNSPAGLTELAIVGNLLPVLSEETAYFLLVRCTRVVAQAAAGSKRNALEPMGSGHAAEILRRWLRQWVAARDRDGVERIVLTAIGNGNQTEVAEMLFTAIGDQVYRAQGHNLDLANKQMELLDTAGWEHASAILPLGLDQLVGGRGVEETASYHEPIEVLEPMQAAERELPELLQKGENKKWRDDGQFTATLLGEDPLAIIKTLKEWLAGGAPAAEISKRVAYAAGMRLARFASSNEVGDWFNPQHTFSFANAVHQAVKRCPSPEVVRGIFHAALAVYMDRFLNVPPAKLPGESAASAAALEKLPADAAILRKELLETLDRQSAVDRAALIVVRYLRLGHPLGDLVDTLAFATVREDLDFHTLQVLEAGYQQAREWNGKPEAEHLLVGVVRDLAAFCPTRRAALKTAITALKLDRGEKIFEEEETVDERR